MKFLQEQSNHQPGAENPTTEKNRIWNCKALAVFIVKMSGVFFVPERKMQ